MSEVSWELECILKIYLLIGKSFCIDTRNTIVKDEKTNTLQEQTTIITKPRASSMVKFLRLFFVKSILLLNSYYKRSSSKSFTIAKKKKPIQKLYSKTNSPLDTFDANVREL